MKLFPQIALVSAIAISGNAMAMQALDDASLSAATGQDGITIAIKPPVSNFDALQGTNYFAGTGGLAGVISIDHIYVHDKDGDAVNAAGEAGAIVLDGFAIAGSAPIVVKIDADANAGNPLLNVNVALPSTLVIRTGDISVAASNRSVANNGIDDRGINGPQNLILDSLDIELGGATLNIQLGAEAQGAMIKTTGTIGGGLTISDLNLNDGGGSVTGGSIYIGTINVRDSGLGDLTLNADIDVDATGLVVTVGGSPTDILLANVRLGDNTAASIGDIEIVGMNMAGTEITISGH